MNKYIILPLLVWLSLLSLYSFAESPNPNLYLHGIWKNKTIENSYYSIHTKGEQLVFIDLSAIESSANTLTSSYIGDINDLLLSRVESTQGVTNQLYLNFISTTEGTITIVCEICTVVPIEIEKIF